MMNNRRRTIRKLEKELKQAQSIQGFIAGNLINSLEAHTFPNDEYTDMFNDYSAKIDTIKTEINTIKTRGVK